MLLGKIAAALDSVIVGGEDRELVAHASRDELVTELLRQRALQRPKLRQLRTGLEQLCRMQRRGEGGQEEIKNCPSIVS